MTKQNHTLQLPQMLTTEQAASYLDIKSSTLNTWRSLSRGPAIKNLVGLYVTALKHCASGWKIKHIPVPHFVGNNLIN